MMTVQNGFRIIDSGYKYAHVPFKEYDFPMTTLVISLVLLVSSLSLAETIFPRPFRGEG